ncbi:hypothetical protein HPB47_020368 [Ixodes persulcatus]|uniref:Uncharacterized protein n=1 Tax=Ixodes persulcatus TaxID=34615 RepID=A0AC60QFP7_IXOPE|nr:hypothetical protein HPB47_020368 [Ixodes persulcatus]
MLVTSTSWNWGEAEDELLKGETVAGGVASRKAGEKQLAARGKNTDTRDAEKVRSFGEGLPGRKAAGEGTPREARRRKRASHCGDGRKTSPRSRACCGTSASTVSPREMHGRTCVVQNFTGDGKGPSIRDYCAMLEQVAKMGNWTDGQLLGMAKCRMIGAAYDFAWRDEKVKLAESFSEFKRLALAYFDTDPPSVCITRFLEARQRPEEEVRAFASRLQALGYDTLICRYVLSKNPATFEAAVEAAVHEERNESLTVREERTHLAQYVDQYWAYVGQYRELDGGA